MTWYIFIVMTGMFADGTHDTYLYTNPNFNTLSECQTEVATNGDDIIKDMLIKFNGKTIKKVYCIEEEKLRQFFQTMESEKESGKNI